MNETTVFLIALIILLFIFRFYFEHQEFKEWMKVVDEYFEDEEKDGCEEV